jgi:hypothetical protein
MEKKTLYYIVTFMALFLGFILNFIITKDIFIFCLSAYTISCFFNRITLPPLFLLFLPLMSMVFLFLIKNKNEEFKNRFYSAYNKINTICSLFSILLLWFYQGLKYSN